MRLVKTLLFFLLLFSVCSFAQTRTPNIGFEDGTFNNWQCYSGLIDASGVITVGPAQAPSSFFSMYGKGEQGLDPFGKFPLLCPNGSNYSVKINDMSAPTNHNKVQRITYTFQAPTSGPYSIIFNYAVVLQNPNHLPVQQPKFTAFVYDVTDGVYIDCPAFDFVAGTSLPGFQQGTAEIDGKSQTAYFKPWSTATIDLRGYLGKTIRLEFSVNDCAVESGSHFGYAYIDVEDSDSISPITGNAYCLGQNTVSLVGPTGFAQYDWYTAEVKKLLRSGSQTFNISPPPPDKTTYALVIHPYDGLGCTDTLYTTVDKINEGFKFVARDTVYGCIGKTFDLTNPAIVAGSSSDNTYSYYVDNHTDALGTVFAYNPNLITQSGLYYIKAVNKEGCTGILPVYVSFELPGLNVVNPAPVKYPATVDITRAFLHKSGITYSFFTDSVSNKPVDDPTAIKYSGIYYVKLTDINGCSSWGKITVTVKPPDPFVLSAPTAFTPNGDGVNDLFKFTTYGYISFGSVRVYNRNGQLVFTFKNISQTWDGTFDGKNIPDGAYYWVFEGTDTYYNVNVTRSGSVSIVR